MGNGPDVPGEWDSSGPSEPPAQLLRRAISHVESLLNRLENPADQPAPEPAAPRVDPPLDGRRARRPPNALSAPRLPSPDQPRRSSDNVVELARTPAELTITDRAETTELPPRRAGRAGG